MIFMSTDCSGTSRGGKKKSTCKLLTSCIQSQCLTCRAIMDLVDFGSYEAAIADRLFLLALHRAKYIRLLSLHRNNDGKNTPAPHMFSFQGALAFWFCVDRCLMEKERVNIRKAVDCLPLLCRSVSYAFQCSPPMCSRECCFSFCFTMLVHSEQRQLYSI